MCLDSEGSPSTSPCKSLSLDLIGQRRTEVPFDPEKMRNAVYDQEQVKIRSIGSSCLGF